MLSKELLTLAQFPSSRVINAKLRHDTVHNHDTEVTGCELLNQVEDGLVLVLI